MVEPTILLLDEPLSNLDASLREEMRFEIRRLHEEMGITSVYVTHDQSEAMVTSDRIAVMNQGRIEQIGTPEEIYEHPRTQFVASFIGRTNCLPALVVDRRSVRYGGLTLAVSANGAMPAPGSAVVVSDSTAGDLDRSPRRTGCSKARQRTRRAHRRSRGERGCGPIDSRQRRAVPLVGRSLLRHRWVDRRYLGRLRLERSESGGGF